MPVAATISVVDLNNAIEKLKRDGLRLDLQLYAKPREALLTYAQYYGLHLEPDYPGLRQHAGYLHVGSHRVFAQYFLPVEARGTVILFHGYFDHAGLCKHVIRACLDNRYAVFMYDQPGHGLSNGDPGVIQDFQDYQRVLNEALLHYGASFPKPLQAIGFSMGGGVLMHHLLQSVERKTASPITKAMLMAPLVKPTQWLKIRFSFWLVRLFRNSVPRVFRRNSSDENYLYFVREADPLVRRDIPMTWLGALRRWVPMMQSMPKSQVPVWLLQGALDETVAWRYNNRFVQRHFPVQQARVLPDASHQLGNERPDIRQPMHDMIREFLS